MESEARHDESKVLRAARSILKKREKEGLCVYCCKFQCNIISYKHTFKSYIKF